MKRLLVLFFTILLSSISLSQGDSLWQRRVVPSNLSSEAHFGHSVALYQNYFLVGAPGDSIYGNNSGSVYIISYDDSHISLIKKLVPDIGQVNEQFGHSVLALNNYIFVGAPGNNEYGDNSGVVYVFGYQDSNWVQLQKIYASNPSAGDAFGFSLSGFVAWNWLLVGAPNKSYNDTTSGALFLFLNKNGYWNYENHLVPPTRNIGQKFGYSHSIVSNKILIGSPGDNDYGNNSGAVYFYLYNDRNHSWHLVSKNYSPEPNPEDQFGFSIDVSYMRCLVGAPYFQNVGKVYLYNLSGTSFYLEDDYQPNDIDFNDRVGFSVSYYDYNYGVGRSFVGIPGGSANNQTGASIVLDCSVYHISQAFYTTPIDGLAGDQYGYSVDNNYNYYLVGAPFNDFGGLNAGSVYLNKWVHWELPVELISFTASISENQVSLNWTTATELNNNGFEVQRKLENSEWMTIGFIKGNGTTTEPRSYSYSDDVTWIKSNKLYYRLKQNDFNGNYNYSNEVEVITLPLEYSLSQNYPNPFNPSTKISYSIKEAEYVSLIVYDVLGNEIATLVNEEKSAGNYEVEFIAKGLSSGILFYQLRVGKFIQTRKMLLMK